MSIYDGLDDGYQGPTLQNGVSFERLHDVGLEHVYLESLRFVFFQSDFLAGECLCVGLDGCANI